MNSHSTTQPLGANVVSLEEFAKIRAGLRGRVVMTCGGFDPIHPGHVSLILESKKYGETLVVVVNGDWFLRHKKGKAFQDLKTRSLIVSGIRGVDYVIPFEIENDTTVARALEAVRPDVLTKGGDRTDAKKLPPEEVAACEKHGVAMVFGVGFEKQWSSSWFLKDWQNFVNSSR